LNSACAVFDRREKPGVQTAQMKSQKSQKSHREVIVGFFKGATGSAKSVVSGWQICERDHGMMA
jgi:hypothetical protein